MEHLLAAALAIEAGQTSLDISRNLDARESEALARLVQDSPLESLELMSISTDAIGSILICNTTLKKLSFCPADRDPASGFSILQAFAKNSTLTIFKLNHVNLSGCAGLLAKILKENTTLRSLQLYDNNLSTDECHAISEALEENTTLETLSYTNNVDEPAAAALAKMLSKNKTLSTLSMFGCPLFGDAAAVTLVKALETNRTLTSLGLKLNALGLPTCTALCTVLEMNTPLTSLDLDHNQLGNRGGAAIFRALAVNSTLRELSMKNTAIGPACGPYVAMLLKHNSTLRKLDLKNNKLSEAVWTQVTKALESNTTITSLTIGSDHPPDIMVLLLRNTALPHLYQLTHVATSLGLHPAIVKNYVDESLFGTVLDSVLEQASEHVSDRRQLDKDSASVVFEYV